MFSFFRKRELRKHLDNQMAEKARRKHIRQVWRLRVWLIEGNEKGVAFQQQYLDSLGFPPIETVKDCDLLLQVLGDVEH